MPFKTRRAPRDAREPGSSSFAFIVQQHRVCVCHPWTLAQIHSRDIGEHRSVGGEKPLSCSLSRPPWLPLAPPPPPRQFARGRPASVSPGRGIEVSTRRQARRTDREDGGVDGTPVRRPIRQPERGAPGRSARPRPARNRGRSTGPQRPVSSGGAVPRAPPRAGSFPARSRTWESAGSRVRLPRRHAPSLRHPGYRTRCRAC